MTSDDLITKLKSAISTGKVPFALFVGKKGSGRDEAAHAAAEILRQMGGGSVHYVHCRHLQKGHQLVGELTKLNPGDVLLLAM